MTSSQNCCSGVLQFKLDVTLIFKAGVFVGKQALTYPLSPFIESVLWLTSPLSSSSLLAFANWVSCSSPVTVKLTFRAR